KHTIHFSPTVPYYLGLHLGHNSSWYASPVVVPNILCPVTTSCVAYLYSSTRPCYSANFVWFITTVKTVKTASTLTMAWSGEVIGHLGVLSSPLAACYAARLFTQLVRHIDGVTSGFEACQVGPQRPALNAPSLDCSAQAPDEPCKTDCVDGPAIVQYSNAAFGRQSDSECSTSSEDCVGEDLDFCILTPHQALDALGGQASQYTKIYHNSLPFVADETEPGTVLSMEAVADRIQAVSTPSFEPSAPHAIPQAESPRPIPSAETEEPLCSHASSQALSAPSSCRSILSEFTASSSFDSLSSERSSFDAAVGHFSPLSQCRGQQRVSSGSSPLSSPFTAASYAQSVIMDCATYQDARPSCDCDGPQTVGSCPEAGAADGDAVSTCDLIGRPSTPLPIGDSWVHARSSSPMGYVRPATRSLVHQEPPKHHHWMLSGAPASPPPPSLPSPVPLSAVALSHVEVMRPSPATSSDELLEDWIHDRRVSVASEPPASACEERAPATLSTRQGSSALRLPSQACCSVSALEAVVSVGLHKAPALPLPVGSPDDESVPPALRYYLAQARAAGDGEAEDLDGGQRRSSSSGSVRSLESADSAVQPGFVRATVEQLNSQGAVCGQVLLPFASSKACSQPRILARGA
ncbi:hypothetical protein Agub_g1945, partial [Astrephomene gubernaculifera]